MVEIIPGLLSSVRHDHGRDYHTKLKAVEPFTDWVHVDISDGKFTPNKTISHDIVTSIRTTKKLEVHLMVKFIEDWIDPFVKVKVSRIIVPIESAYQPIQLIRHVHRHGLQIGFSLNPETPTDRLQHLVDKIDTALVLGVYPGYQAQHFIHGTMKKIQELKRMRPDLVVELDGGVDPGVARKAVEMGANIIIAGSFVFDHLRKHPHEKEYTYQEQLQHAIEELKEAVSGVVPYSFPKGGEAE